VSDIVESDELLDLEPLVRREEYCTASVGFRLGSTGAMTDGAVKFFTDGMSVGTPRLLDKRRARATSTPCSRGRSSCCPVFVLPQ
jgi:hypothetical protein